MTSLLAGIGDVVVWMKTYHFSNIFLQGPCFYVQVNTAASSQQTSSRRPLTCSAQAAAVAPTETDWRSKAPKDIRVLVVGPTGYIGK